MSSDKSLKGPTFNYEFEIYQNISKYIKLLGEPNENGLKNFLKIFQRVGFFGSIYISLEIRVYFTYILNISK